MNREEAKAQFRNRLKDLASGLARHVSVVRDFQFFVCESWQIASDRSGSGNTANIGSISRIQDILNGNGMFTHKPLAPDQPANSQKPEPNPGSTRYVATTKEAKEFGALLRRPGAGAGHRVGQLGGVPGRGGGLGLGTGARLLSLRAADPGFFHAAENILDMRCILENEQFDQFWSECSTTVKNLAKAA